MSQSFWESGTVEEVQAEQPREPAGAGALAVSADDFSALEERILRAVELVKKERQARAEAEERAARFEGELREQKALAEQWEKEIDTLHA
ncbi:MAG: hypothetical protein ACRD27_12415, partial [Terracidiphilus sp.]